MKWIFFDLGWTLVDERRAHCGRLTQTAEILSKHGRDYSVEFLMELCEKAATDFASSPYWGMVQGLNLPSEVVAEIRESAKYRKEDEQLYEGAPDVLRALSDRAKLGIIANQSAGTNERLEEWGVRDHFELVLASAELGLSKPDPLIFEAAAAQAGCAPSDALMVGDRIDNDIGPANLQGWNTCRVLTGFSRFQSPRVTHERPDLTISAVVQLDATSKTWFERCRSRDWCGG